MPREVVSGQLFMSEPKSEGQQLRETAREEGFILDDTQVNSPIYADQQAPGNKSKRDVLRKKSAATTTAQSLGSLIKSARDIMRKDKGLNGDLDRLPMLTWIMFLKFLDDLELQREEEATLAGKKFQRAIDPPYRWRDWAAKPEGITGDELISFVNNEEAVLPDGSRGPGLFASLRSLTGRNGGCGNSFRFERGTAHPRLTLRIDAARNARRRWRLRRILHAATGRAIHGRRRRS